MKHPSSRMLFSYWDALRGDRAAPERGEIEPGAIRHILADTFILEVGADNRTRFRLGGTRLCALFGRELRGEALHGLWPADAQDEMQQLIDIVIDERAGLVAGVVGATNDKATLDLEMILLPLRHQGRTHVRIIGALSATALPPWIGLHPLTQLRTVSHRVIRSDGGRPVAPAPLGEAAVAKRGHLVVHRGGRL